MSSDPQLAGLTTQPAERHKHIRARGYIGSSALGISDGLVTNLAFLSGFAGATNNLPLIRFAGIASMLAGAISCFLEVSLRSGPSTSSTRRTPNGKQAR